MVGGSPRPGRYLVTLRIDKVDVRVRCVVPFEHLPQAATAQIARDVPFRAQYDAVAGLKKAISAGAVVGVDIIASNQSMRSLWRLSID